jgi:hypothetical protein
VSLVFCRQAGRFTPFTPARHQKRSLRHLSASAEVTEAQPKQQQKQQQGQQQKQQQRGGGKKADAAKAITPKSEDFSKCVLHVWGIASLCWLGACIRSCYGVRTYVFV